MAQQTLRFRFDIASPPIYKSTHPIAIEHVRDVQKAVNQLRSHTEKEYGKTVITLDPVKKSAKQKANHSSQRFTCDITYSKNRDSCFILVDLCNFALQHFRASRFFCDTGSGMAELKWLSKAHSEALNEVERSLTHALSEAEEAAFKSAISACGCSGDSYHPKSDIEKDLGSFEKKMTKRAGHESALQASVCEIKEQQEHSRNEQAKYWEGGQALITGCKEKLDGLRVQLSQVRDGSELGRDEGQSVDATQEAEQMLHNAEEALRELKVHTASRREMLKRQNRVALAQNATIYRLERENIMEERDRERQKEDLRLLIYRLLICLPLFIIAGYYAAQPLIVAWSM